MKLQWVKLMPQSVGLLWNLRKTAADSGQVNRKYRGEVPSWGSLALRRR